MTPAPGLSTDTSELTLALARRASALTYDALPDTVLAVVGQALLDWFGVTLGGSAEAAPAILLAALPARDAEDRRAVSVVGHATRLAPRDAALVNGTASHVLDFDDVNARFLGHASVAVVAAVLALAEQRDAAAADLVTAFVAGYETACRVAIAIGPQPYINGFHYTGTAGTLGAAAGCANLLGLDPERTSLALGIAASEAAGLKCNIGTMTKSLHAGKACENGLLAAELAARGYTASAGAIEAAQGFAALSGGGCDAAAALADPPAGYHLPDNLFKYHASCYWSHSTIEGVGALAADHRLSADDVDHLELHITDLELGTCAIAEPHTGLEVKFSLGHLAAMALLRRDTTVITDALAADPEVIALRGRVHLVHDGVPGDPTRVTLTTRSQGMMETAVDVNTPDRDLRRQGERLSAKFARLAAPVIGPAAAEELRALITTSGPELSVRELMTLTRPAAQPAGATG